MTRHTINSGDQAALWVRPAVNEDSIDIWRWRNDAHTRAMSTTSDFVPWERHSAWYDTLLADPSRTLYIGCTSAGEKVGMCRFDQDEAGYRAEVSLALNPQFRNKGQSAALLQAAILAFRAVSDAHLLARIKKLNEASIKCFARSGFLLEVESGDYFIYRYRD